VTYIFAVIHLHSQYHVYYWDPFSYQYKRQLPCAACMGRERTSVDGVTDLLLQSSQSVPHIDTIQAQ